MWYLPIITVCALSLNALPGSKPSCEQEVAPMVSPTETACQIVGNVRRGMLARERLTLFRARNIAVTIQSSMACEPYEFPKER